MLCNIHVLSIEIDHREKLRNIDTVLLRRMPCDNSLLIEHINFIVHLTMCKKFLSFLFLKQLFAKGEVNIGKYLQRQSRERSL